MAASNINFEVMLPKPPIQLVTLLDFPAILWQRQLVTLLQYAAQILKLGVRRSCAYELCMEMQPHDQCYTFLLNSLHPWHPIPMKCQLYLDQLSLLLGRCRQCSGNYEARGARGGKYEARIEIFCILAAIDRFSWISRKAESR
jgi:hypothetical protein